jgi:multiple sugar transport system ATP-binding protein
MTDTDGSRATVVARLDASARVRPDEPIELAVDVRRLHFFDLDSGEAIGG